MSNAQHAQHKRRTIIPVVAMGAIFVVLFVVIFSLGFGLGSNLQIERPAKQVTEPLPKVATFIPDVEIEDGVN